MKDSSKEIESLIKDYYDQIFSYCLYKVKKTEEAYDITQNVFLELNIQYEKIDPNKVPNWLYSVARNKIARYFIDLKVSREQYAEIPVAYVEDLYASIPFEDNFISDDEIEEQKNKIISKLRPKEKKLYIERFVKKSDYAELAEEYNISEQTVRKRVSRLKRRIIFLIEH